MSSLFANVEMAPRDPILGLTEAFNADTRATKVNLGVGVYQDASGKLPLLGAVKTAEKARVESAPARGYQPIEGAAAYNQAVQKLLFGEGSPIIADGRCITFEALGGTGALKIGGDYLRRLLPQAKFYISDPSWENHRAVFETIGFTVEAYPYYDPDTKGVAFDKMKAYLNGLAANSIVLLHACCHNPTGADLSTEQWKEIVAITKAKSLVPFLDMAYQGFADGIEEDAVAVKLFAESGLPFLIASSFSKSFSLYGERVGSLTIVTSSKDESARVLSQVKRTVRTNYSNPPTHGGQVVATALASPELRALWEEELAGMRVRIREMRQALVEKLKAQAPSHDFDFVIQQRGMFSYSGLTKAQVDRLREEYSIYAVDTGRICVAALNSGNIDYVVSAIAKVL